jgi:hypothetical protein
MRRRVSSRTCWGVPNGNEVEVIIIPAGPGHLPAHPELVDQPVVVTDQAEVPGRAAMARSVRSDAPHIHVKTIAHVVSRIGHLRDPIENLGFAGQAEHSAQDSQGADIDARDHRAAEVKRDTVRLAMMQSRGQALVARPFLGAGDPPMESVGRHP